MIVQQPLLQQVNQGVGVFVTTNNDIKRDGGEGGEMQEEEEGGEMQATMQGADKRKTVVVQTTLLDPFASKKQRAAPTQAQNTATRRVKEFNLLLKDRSSASELMGNVFITACTNVEIRTILFEAYSLIILQKNKKTPEDGEIENIFYTKPIRFCRVIVDFFLALNSPTNDKTTKVRLTAVEKRIRGCVVFAHFRGLKLSEAQAEVPAVDDE